MWMLWWLLYLVMGLVALVAIYVVVVLPLVFWYSAAFPKECLRCKQRMLKYVKFVTTHPNPAASGKFNPRAYYVCQSCQAAFKLEFGDWYPVDRSEVEEMN